MDSQSNVLHTLRCIYRIQSPEARALLKVHICNLLSIYIYYIAPILPFDFTDQTLTGFGFSLELHFFKCFAS